MPRARSFCLLLVSGSARVTGYSEVIPSDRTDDSHRSVSTTGGIDRQIITCRFAMHAHHGSNKGHDALNLQCSCGLVGCHLRRKVFEFAVSHETHNPKVGGSNPPPATNLKLHKDNDLDMVA